MFFVKPLVSYCLTFRPTIFFILVGRRGQVLLIQPLEKKAVIGKRAQLPGKRWSVKKTLHVGNTWKNGDAMMISRGRIKGNFHNYQSQSSEWRRCRSLDFCPYCRSPTTSCVPSCCPIGTQNHSNFFLHLFGRIPL